MKHKQKYGYNQNIGFKTKYKPEPRPEDKLPKAFTEHENGGEVHTLIAYHPNYGSNYQVVGMGEHRTPSAISRHWKQGKEAAPEDLADLHMVSGFGDSAMWVYDDKRHGRQGEAFVGGASEAITACAAIAGLNTSKPIYITFSSVPFKGHVHSFKRVEEKEDLSVFKNLKHSMEQHYPEEMAIMFPGEGKGKTRTVGNVQIAEGAFQLMSFGTYYDWVDGPSALNGLLKQQGIKKFRFWLCPALLDYFKTAPENMYARFSQDETLLSFDRKSR